jgi:hypothetical protein
MSQPAWADINLGVPVITPNGPNFVWAYPVNLDAAQFINTAGFNASFITLYDVPGLVDNGVSFTSNLGTLSGVGSTPLLGMTPPGFVIADSPLMENATVAFTGTAASNQTIGTLLMVDQFSTPDGNTVQYAAQATNLDLSPERNSTFVASPAPEPGTLALVGTVLVGGVVALRRRLFG